MPIILFKLIMLARNIQSGQNQDRLFIDIDQFFVKLRLNLINGILKTGCNHFCIRRSGFCLKGEFST